MKTAKEWMKELSSAGEGHVCACVCDRCKNGRETFLLERDIVQIQLHVLHWAASQITPDGNPDGARNAIMREIQRVAEP